MSKSSIDNLFDDYRSIYECLVSAKKVSEASSYQLCLTKFIIVSIASFFEKKIENILKNYAENVSNTHLSNFIYNQALEFKYHTLFDWGDKGKPEKPRENINKFLKLFGEDFLTETKDKIKKKELDRSIKAFVEIGHLRNILVHQELSSYSLTKTTDEVLSLYNDALVFIDFLEKDLFLNEGDAFLFDIDSILFNESSSEDTFFEKNKGMEQSKAIDDNLIRLLEDKTSFLKRKAKVIILSQYSYILGKNIREWLSDKNIYFDCVYPDFSNEKESIKKQDILKEIKNRYKLICDVISCI